MTPAQFDDIVEAAAERGAKKALAAIGLADEYAADDVRGLRNLFKMYRLAQKTAITSFVKAFMLVILGAIALGAGQWFISKVPITTVKLP